VVRDLCNRRAVLLDRKTAFLRAKVGVEEVQVLRLGFETKTKCFDWEGVNRIPLGGVEPYQPGVYQALPGRTAAAANALDRIALSACEERAKSDFAVPSSAERLNNRKQSQKHPRNADSATASL
jgi:hypothetical protein